MIQVDKLVKSFGAVKAVDGISFHVSKGEILGFLGPNGAGKSTTMKMLTGFLTPSSGSASIGGFDVVKQSLQARKIIGYLPESAASYKNMTVQEFLDFIAEIRGFQKQEKKQRLNQVIETTSLTSVYHQTIETLSKGFRQRVGFAQALIHDPPVLILDEPTDGLDPNQKFEARNLIKRMYQEKAIILSTHILEEMEALCDRTIIIARGKIVADSSPSELIKQSERYNSIRIQFPSHPGPGFLEALQKLDAVQRVELINSPEQDQIVIFLIIPVEKINILPVIQHFLDEQRLTPLEIQLEKGQMEEVFRKLTIGTY